MKDEVFEICDALALGESLLERVGLRREAGGLAAVFTMVEGRLVRAGPADAGAA